MKAAIQQWFLMLTTREKAIIVMGGFFTVSIVLWGMVYEPIKNQQGKLGKDITERTNELRWMQASSQKIKQAKSQPKVTKPVSRGRPSSIVNQQLRRFGLQKNSKMSGIKQISLRLRDVQADAVMKLLGALEMQYSITILSLEITPKGTVGMVDASIKLGRHS